MAMRQALDGPLLRLASRAITPITIKAEVRCLEAERRVDRCSMRLGGSGPHVVKAASCSFRV